METEFKGLCKYERDFFFNCWADRKSRSMYRQVIGLETEIEGFMSLIISIFSEFEGACGKMVELSVTRRHENIIPGKHNFIARILYQLRFVIMNLK